MFTKTYPIVRIETLYQGAPQPSSFWAQINLELGLRLKLSPGDFAPGLEGLQKNKKDTNSKNNIQSHHRSDIKRQSAE